MKRIIIDCTLLIFSVLGCAACSALPEKVPTPQGNTPMNATTKTPVMTMQPIQTPSSAPGSFNSLPAGLYVLVRRGQTAGDFLETWPLYALSLDGREYGPLLDTISGYASLSPDEKTLAYTVYVADHNNPSPPFYALRRVDLETGKAQDFNLPDCKLSDDTTPAWSPDGTLLAFSCGSYISKLATASDDLTVISSLIIANAKEKHEQISGLIWSPNGKYLSFYTAIDPLFSVPGPSSDIDSVDFGPYLISSECPTQETTCQVTPASIGIEGISISRWTPDNLLVVLRDQRPNENFIHPHDNRFNLFDPVTKKITKSILMPVDWYVHSFAWSPDNKWIAYESGSIYMMPASGGESKVLSEKGGQVMFWLQIDK